MRIREVCSKKLGYNIDNNIKPLVEYLNEKKAVTTGSCGHDGIITLKDNRSLDNAKVAIRKLHLPKGTVKVQSEKGKYTGYIHKTVEIPSDLPYHTRLGRRNKVRVKSVNHKLQIINKSIKGILDR